MSVFFDPEGRLRNGFGWRYSFLLLAGMLVLALMLARKAEADLAIGYQALIVWSASRLCQRLRGRPTAELLGTLNADWLRQLGARALLGVFWMFVPALFLTLMGAITWQASATDPEGAVTTLGVFAVVSRCRWGCTLRRIGCRAVSWVLVSAVKRRTDSSNQFLVRRPIG